MKLIIDIDKEKYEWIKKNNPNADTNSIVGAVADGTPYEERPQVADCENCQFKKFSEDLGEKLVNVMVDNGITDFDELAKRCGVSYLHQDSVTKSDTQI